ncbi:MAG: hypothetical protein ACT4P5_12395 [Armatimonadota bacterium]
MKATSVWIRVLQFLLAVLVMGFLAAGPQVWDAFGTLLDYLHRARTAPRNTVTTSVEPAARPAATRISAPQQPPVEAVAPRPVLPSHPVVAPPAYPRAAEPPAIRTKPTIRPKPVSSPSPAKPKARIKATPRPAAAVVTAQALSTPVSLTPKQYFERLMREGSQLYQTGWYGPAMGRFKQAALVMPGSASAQLWTARAAIRVGRYDIARQALERTIEIAPASDAAREARSLLEQVNKSGG